MKFYSGVFINHKYYYLGLRGKKNEDSAYSSFDPDNRFLVTYSIYSETVAVQ